MYATLINQKLDVAGGRALVGQRLTRTVVVDLQGRHRADDDLITLRTDIALVIVVSDDRKHRRVIVLDLQLAGPNFLSVTTWFPSTLDLLSQAPQLFLLWSPCHHGGRTIA